MRRTLVGAAMAAIWLISFNIAASAQDASEKEIERYRA